MKTAIVCGANGFIGRALVEHLSARDYTVYAVMRHVPACSTDSGRIHPVDYDTLYGMQEKEIRGAVCFNLAWGGVAGEARADYHIQLRNVEFQLSLMERMADQGAACFVGAGSISGAEAACFMGRDGVKVDGRFIYSTAKLAADYMGRAVCSGREMRYVNAVIGNVYGEGGSDRLLLHSTVIKLLRNEKTAFTQGTQWYDFIYVEDAAAALAAAGEKGKGNTSYYLGSGHPRKLRQYLEYIGQVLGVSEKMGFGLSPMQNGGLPREAFSIEKLRKDTGFEPSVSYEAGIRRLVEYYRKNI